MRLSEAAAAAGVKRFIPADWGSVDSRTKQARDLVPLFEKKVQVRQKLEDLASTHPGFTWTSIVGGHFFDWGLKKNFLHFDLKSQKAEILDDGNAKTSQSTFSQLSKAVLRIFDKEAETANKMLFLQSFCVSQNEVLRSLEKVTGTKWAVEHISTEEFIKEHKPAADAGDSIAIDHLVFALGVLDGNWEVKEGFSMSLLGLQNEDLDKVVADVIAEETQPK